MKITIASAVCIKHTLDSICRVYLFLIIIDIGISIIIRNNN